MAGQRQYNNLLALFDNFDQYEDAAAPAAFEAQVVDRAANGNYYLRVTAVDAAEPAILIYDDPIIKETSDKHFQSAKYFFNPEGATVRGFELAVGDIFELSAVGFVDVADISVDDKTTVVAASSGKLEAKS